MNVFDFITPDEIEDLPEDPDAAFINFVRICQTRMSARIGNLSDETENGWNEIVDARIGFINVVVAAAKRYKISPFSEQSVPTTKEFNYSDYREFSTSLDHHIMQSLIGNSIRGKKESVSLGDKEKGRIRGHLNALKTCLDNSHLSGAKKSALLRKLAEFEAELDKRRLSFLAVTKLAFEILALPGGVWATAELAPKLVTNVLQIVGEAKIVEDEARIVSAYSQPPAITSSAGNVISENDDEIPF